MLLKSRWPAVLCDLVIAERRGHVVVILAGCCLGCQFAVAVEDVAPGCPVDHAAQESELSAQRRASEAEAVVGRSRPTRPFTGNQVGDGLFVHGVSSADDGECGAVIRVLVRNAAVAPALAVVVTTGAEPAGVVSEDVGLGLAVTARFGSEAVVDAAVGAHRRDLRGAVCHRTFLEAAAAGAVGCEFVHIFPLLKRLST